MSTTEIVCVCPYCHKFLDNATGGEGRVPRPGAISICAYCFQVSCFDELLQMQKFDIKRLDAASQATIKSLIRELRAKLGS